MDLRKELSERGILPDPTATKLDSINRLLQDDSESRRARGRVSLSSTENSAADEPTSMDTLEQTRARYMSLTVRELRQELTSRGIRPNLVGTHKVDFVERLMQYDDSTERGLPG